MEGALLGGEDASISQEERDLRLAMALQQQENASAYETSKKRHDQTIAAQKSRTGRSSVGTSLPHIRKVQKANGGMQGAGSGMYTAPENDSDAAFAAELQKEEQASLGTAVMVERMVKNDAAITLSSQTRNARSGQSAFKK